MATKENTSSTEGANIHNRLNQEVVWPGSDIVCNVRGSASMLATLAAHLDDPSKDKTEIVGGIRLIVSGLRAEMDRLRDAMDCADIINAEMKGGTA